jgi:hypothetical protein
MNDKQILEYINYSIVNLHGLPVQPHSELAEVRLEPYAIIILFHQLSQVWPCLDIDYVSDILQNSCKIQDIIIKVRVYDSTIAV